MRKDINIEIENKIQKEKEKSKEQINKIIENRDRTFKQFENIYSNDEIESLINGWIEDWKKSPDYLRNIYEINTKIKERQVNDIINMSNDDLYFTLIQNAIDFYSQDNGSEESEWRLFIIRTEFESRLKELKFLN